MVWGIMTATTFAGIIEIMNGETTHGLLWISIGFTWMGMLDR